MRQKAITGAIAIAMAFLVAPAASAAVKEGAACKKVGQVSTVGTLKFTCVKKGSKLVWGKGVAAKSAPAMTPTPAATPIAAATPMASASPTPVTAPAEVPASKSASPSLPSYSLAKVRENNSAANCWTIINSNVYDLTKWAAMHPGGPQVIRGLCGIDGTSAFTARHRNQSDPEATLESYLIGTLAK